jgi:cellulose synthase/poly-beta-1,6-N-acetylglucosamine synthase-like glycosyltransferase
VLKWASTDKVRSDLATDINLNLLKKINHDEAIKYQVIPFRFDHKKLTILTSYPEDIETHNFLRERFGTDIIEEWIITDRDISDLVKKFYKDELSKLTVWGLFNRDPEESAYKTFTPPQIVFILFLLLSVTCAIWFRPLTSLIVISAAIQFLYLSSILYKFIISMVGAKNRLTPVEPIQELLNVSELPVYTILVPLFKEPESVVITLINAIKKIDYPLNKLDIIFLFEDSDLKTIEIAKKHHPPSSWRFFYVPNGTPTTKPKACNYGLHFARGEYMVIYDAEDIPDPDQLKKAVAAFKSSPRQYSCFQAQLNYYNKNENFLTKMFTLEYTYWFDYLLTGLSRLQLPIPLGGTSNHFKVEVLKKLSGWDPFNVTEDADLGIRMYAEGLKVGIINSTTYEEANCKLKNWIRQRSRWIKGYMQTSLIYNRHPIKLIKKIGFKNWMSFQLLVTGTPVVFLLNLIMWAIFLIWIFTRTTLFSPFFPPIIVEIGFINFLFGNITAIVLNLTAVLSRKYYNLIPYAILNPFYWVLHSISSYKALWQLLFKPSYWEKTTHGISKQNSDKYYYPRHSIYYPRHSINKLKPIKVY